ncbi:hypothetical protein MMC11_006967 [Xylographa trunciseda]|nr:hypothetical protein [Xylographa trunciseda]
MGGFVFDLEDASLAEGEAFTTAKHSILTVTPRGMALLARCGYLPKISREDILDKSKSDNLSKVLSILQALWMLSQIVGRLIVKLPITLLEINTLAHILSALIIYMLWWNKPKLINEPTRLRGDWVAPICAYMYMSSQISGWKSMKPGILQKTWMEPEFSILAFKPHEDPRLVNQISVDDKSSVQAMITAVASPQSVYTEAGVVNPPSIASGEFTTRPIPSFRTSRMTASSIASILESRLESSRELRSTRWALAAEAMNIHPAIASRVIPRETVINGKQVSWFEPVLEELVNDSMGNWVTDNLLKDISGFVMGMTVWSASMAYGGMHAIAWKSYFPSKTEALLWRASSVIIAGSGLVWVMLNMLARTFKGFHTYWKRVEYLHAHWASLVGLGSTATICGLLYILARVYLVIEAFISLRQLPELAYETLQWTQLVPHL